MNCRVTGFLRACTSWKGYLRVQGCPLPLFMQNKPRCLGLPLCIQIAHICIVTVTCLLWSRKRSNDVPPSRLEQDLCRNSVIAMSLWWCFQPHIIIYRTF